MATLFAERVVFFSDESPNGIYVYERGEKEDPPYSEMVKQYEGVFVQGIGYLSGSLYKRSGSDPLLCAFMAGDTATDVKTKPNFIWGIYDG